jgi:hypothetical protein
MEFEPAVQVPAFTKNPCKTARDHWQNSVSLALVTQFGIKQLESLLSNDEGWLVAIFARYPIALGLRSGVSNGGIADCLPQGKQRTGVPVTCSITLNGLL